MSLSIDLNRATVATIWTMLHRSTVRALSDDIVFCARLTPTVVGNQPS
jgi:hypothetical protein